MMAKLRKVFRFRMKPTVTNKEQLARIAGARRFIWNWAFSQRRAHYAATGKNLPPGELSRRLTALKQQPGTEWLNDVHAGAMQQVLADLNQAYVNFFEKRARFPKYKTRKKDRARFRIPQHVSVSDGVVYVPKIGSVAIRQSQLVEGITKSATFKRDAHGNWDVSLVTEFMMPDTALPPVDPAHVVGIDLGLKEFAVLSDGDRVPIPQFYRKSERELRRAQRVFSRREKGSNRKYRAKLKVIVVHQKIAARRKDFLHKLTTKLVLKYDGICIEDLSVNGLAKTKLAKSVLDAGLGEFRRQLKYKSIWNRKHLAVIDRWYPSSRTCSVCGWINQALTLSDREWDCFGCGAHHNRDFNASVNIRAEGLKLMAVGHTDILNAQGLNVRLPQLEAAGVELRILKLWSVN
jgi:putative transposase